MTFGFDFGVLSENIKRQGEVPERNALDTECIKI